MTAEPELAAAVLGALLRENFAGVSDYIESDGQVPVLAMPGLPALELEPDGFLTEFRIRPPVPSLTLDEVGKALQALADPADADGVRAFTQECREALAAHHLRGQEAPRITRDLARRPAQAWRGHEGQLAYGALAATQPHPAYPTAAAGLPGADALAYAPEYQPAFPLNWAAIPRTTLTRGGPSVPSWWPRPSDVGLPAALDPAHELIPVHPLTARRALPQALTEAGLPAAKLIAPATRLKVTPILSARTVAVTSQPGVHLKLPLPGSTFSRHGLRSIVPGALPDGALVRAIVAEAASASPPLAELLLADEGRYAHASHSFLGYLMRQLPGGLDRCRLVPLAALLAPVPPGPGPGGRTLVMGELAREHGDGTVTGLFRDYLDVLFGVHVDLFVRFGVALESHQQNTALVLAGPDDPLRLLVKGFGGALIHYKRLAAAPIPVPEPGDFADPRLLTSSDDALADVFITTTVHLCAGALAFGLARLDQAPQAVLLGLVRQSLNRALDRYPGHPAAALLRARVLTADRLPGQRMLTMGTLMTRSRSGASNFCGTTGPNYLAPGVRPPPSPARPPTA